MLGGANYLSKWRRSFALGFGVAILFAAGTATIGTMHHVMWLATDRAPRLTEDAESSDFEVPIISALRQSARESQWRNEIHAAGFFLLMQSDNDGKLPAGGAYAEDGTGLLGWGARALRGSYATEWNLDASWRQGENAVQCKCLIEQYIRPDVDRTNLFDANGFGLSQLAGNVHVLGINRQMSLDEMSDGLSETILIGEATERLRPWCDPANVRDPRDGINQVPWGFGAPPHVHGATFLMCDGRVRTISEDIDPTVLKALATPNGGEETVFD